MASFVVISISAVVFSLALAWFVRRRRDGNLPGRRGLIPAASMRCDICDRPGHGTIVKAKNFAAAVKKGFDPFAAGLAEDPMGGATILGKTTAESWRDDSISGIKSMSDWNVCGGCMTTLKTYL